jgi:hypothetical protein
VTSTADVLYSFLPKDGSVREDLALWKWLGNKQVRGLLFGMDTLIFWPRYFQRADPRWLFLREFLHKPQELLRAFDFSELK